jgi:hypothetical protein
VQRILGFLMGIASGTELFLSVKKIIRSWEKSVTDAARATDGCVQDSISFN